ncbi:30S ribosomal protein S3 [Candidatus Uhrbacteria bacterium]|nr:30S ribosomal protein S3 [Candidatus Uhrbacteria bacterium]
MGQKVNPKVFRTGVLFPWDSKWFARGRDFAENLKTDLAIKKFLEKELKGAGIARIEIERTRNAITVLIHSAKPGVIIGRQGAGIDELKKKIKQKFFASKKSAINLNVIEVDKPGMNAQLVVLGMVEDIEKRMPYRRVLKSVIDRVQKSGALGVKVMVGGRLNGAEIANQEMLSWGKVPLHTLRANIDYCRGTAHTTQGTIGVKVWIYKGEIFENKNS